jgi:hypothetical protein
MAAIAAITTAPAVSPATIAAVSTPAPMVCLVSLVCLQQGPGLALSLVLFSTCAQDSGILNMMV